ncbi:HD domain-containing protein [uncultured Phycicoccus sp.]|uniref:HD domain-containing protein n=1 Tax=uncultured Phycicoccus sp. TaxID=661422 RepID=UPI00262CAE65|nr:HD domain-containing protein [uncultured Phycicoccus sp.]
MTMNVEPTLGTIDWSRRTGGRLERGQRRGLLADVVRVHAANAVGRVRLAVHLHPGRNAHLAPSRLLAPDSALTRAATHAATRVLPSVLLGHSHRTYTFGRALGELEGIDVDTELLYAAALLHDTGLVLAAGTDDFTLASARVAWDVAEEVGLSTAATETLQTAITMHHSPHVTPDAGPVAYLLSAGAGVDVVGIRSWDLPTSVLDSAVTDHPREGFKKYFARAWADEAARVPEGRARLLRQYGAFTTAVRLAPFDE